MRTFALFLGLTVVALTAMGLFTYPAWLLLHTDAVHRICDLIGYDPQDFRFHRIGERVGMIAAAVGFVLVARRAGLWSKQSLGYALPRPLFIRELLLGLLQGAVGMAILVVIMTLLGLLDWSDASTATAGKITKIVFNRLLSGLAVGAIEETFFRGAMFAGIQRESGQWPAIILTSIIFSATHFFASFHIEAAQVTSSSGWDLLAGTMHAFADPLRIADAFIALFAVGVALALVRAITGNIAASWGLHAGWVWVMLIAHELTKPIRGQPLSFLLSQFDGFVGWLVLLGVVIQTLTLNFFYKRRVAAAQAPQTSRA